MELDSITTRKWCHKHNSRPYELTGKFAFINRSQLFPVHSFLGGVTYPLVDADLVRWHLHQRLYLRHAIACLIYLRDLFLVSGLWWLTKATPSRISLVFSFQCSVSFIIEAQWIFRILLSRCYFLFGRESLRLMACVGNRWIVICRFGYISNINFIVKWLPELNMLSADDISPSVHYILATLFLPWTFSRLYFDNS